VAAFGLVGIIKPVRRLGMPTRRRGIAIAAAGVLVAVVGFLVPARESRTSRATVRLDEFIPAWQFREHHTLEIAAPPESVYQAIRQVRADEIGLFRLLTWIRRGGRRAPESILNAGSSAPLIDVALKSGFVTLAEDVPRELVIGTVVVAPPGTRGELTRDVFTKSLPPGFALAAMNFSVTPLGDSRSLVSTETRVFANSPSAKRNFAVYWRLIYPGSALIRVMWLRAIRTRATARSTTSP
jgi:hypothetical protein